MNPRAETLCHCTTAEAKDKPISDVLTFVDERDDQPLGNPIDYILAEHPQPQRDSLQILVTKNGKRAAVETSVALMRDKKNNNIRGAVLVIRDVTQSRMLTNKLSWQASHDALTGLINRQYFEEKLLQAITSIHQENHHHVLCYLDLDRFKLVNDTCGHVAGDELLKQVVKIIQSQIRALDSLARLGGDEFAIILYQCPLDDAISIIEKVIISIQQFRFIWDDKYFSIGVSIGLVELNYDVSDISEILNIFTFNSSMFSFC